MPKITNGFKVNYNLVEAEIIKTEFIYGKCLKG